MLGIGFHARVSNFASGRRGNGPDNSKPVVSVETHGLDYLHGQSIAAENSDLGFKSCIVVEVRGRIRTVLVLEAQNVRVFWKNRNFRSRLVETCCLQSMNYRKCKNNGQRGQYSPFPLPQYSPVVQYLILFLRTESVSRSVILNQWNFERL